DRFLADPSEERRYRDALDAVRGTAACFARLERPASPTASRLLDLERRVARPKSGVNDFDQRIGRAILVREFEIRAIGFDSDDARPRIATRVVQGDIPRVRATVHDDPRHEFDRQLCIPLAEDVAERETVRVSGSANDVVSEARNSQRNTRP